MLKERSAASCQNVMVREVILHGERDIKRQREREKEHNPVVSVCTGQSTVNDLPETSQINLARFFLPPASISLKVQLSYSLLSLFLTVSFFPISPSFFIHVTQ